MSSVRAEIDRLGMVGYEFAKRIGMSEHRLNRLLKGRVKNVTDDDVARIAGGLKQPAGPVRAELERRAREHREELGRTA